VFAVVLRYRNLYAAFIVVVGLILFQIILENLLIGHNFLIALTDPFGQNAVRYATQYWTLKEQNSLAIPLTGTIILNRILWILFSFGVFLDSVRRFSFTKAAHTKLLKISSRVDVSITPMANSALPLVKGFQFTLYNQLKTVHKLSRFDFNFITRSWMFIVLVVLGLAAVLFMLLKITNRTDVTLLPATQLILSVPTLVFINIVLLISFIYSGMIIHRERAAHINQLVDIAPIPNWVFLISKFFTILKMQFLLLTLLMLMGISIQIANGYFVFELKLYVFHLFTLTFLSLAIWAMASIFIHTLIPNVYAGIFILLLGWLGIGGLASTGFNYPLLLFNYNEVLIYSDLNGYGHLLAPYLYMKIFWLLAALLLLILASLFWNRGVNSNLQERLLLAGKRCTSQLRIISLLLLVSFVLVGWDILDKEKTDDSYSKKNLNTAYKNFETRFKRYEGFSQPKITSMQVKLDFFPNENRFEATGHYTLINKTNDPIDTLLIKTGFDEITRFDLSRSGQIIQADSLVQFFVVKLEQSLSPDDSLQLTYRVKNKPNTFFVRNSNVLKNGSFIRQDAFPRIGYFLKDQENESESSRATNYQTADADLIYFDATVSTTNSQIALAPGTLNKTWEENGRHFYHYKADRPIKYAFSFHSGEYSIAQSQWKEIDLKIFYHPNHDFNLKDMFRGIKGALDYNTKNFGTYQHQSANVVEFPNSEGSFATSFANIIPISETRFISNVSKKTDKINLPFYVPAHELTHQWWGNQLMPAKAVGATMLTESITEYISLKIYEKEFGKEQAQKFLKHQQQRYLVGRTTEQNQESPLIHVKQDQSYIAYGRGTIAFNTLAHFINEENLNRELNDFLNSFKFKGAPYPTSTNLLDQLRKRTPDTLAYLLIDYFETVTLHELAIEKASITKIKDEFNVQLTLEYSKLRENKPASISDYIEIGCYDEEGNLFYTHTAFLSEKMNQIQFKLSSKPAKLTADPDLLLIEKERDNNSWKF
jgi:ABC-2 type transport system permease protein